jgi:hypothetical protein
MRKAGTERLIEEKRNLKFLAVGRKSRGFKQIDNVAASGYAPD